MGIKVFGVNRDIEIPLDVFPTQEELQEMESKMPGCEHGWFDSVYKGTKLHYRKWLPKGGTPPKAIVIFMHGIQAHAGNAVVMKDGTKLNMSLLIEKYVHEQGFALYAFDHYGHGYSEGTRTLIPGTWENHKNDLIKFSNMVAAFHASDIPLFLQGESYGSCLCIHAARQFQDDPSSGPAGFKGIIVTAPAIVGDLPPQPLYFILRYMLAPAFPRWTPFFMPNIVSPERIWRDPEVLAEHTRSRKREMMIDASGEKFRLGTGLNLVLAMDRLRSKVIPGFKTPFCVIHGTEDHGVLISGSEFLYETAATPEADKEFLRMEGGYHDLLGDPRDAPVCVEHAVNFMKKHMT